MAKGFTDEKGKFRPTDKKNGVKSEDVKSESAEKLIDQNKSKQIKSLKELKENADENNLDQSVIIKIQELEGDDVFVEDVEQKGSAFGNGDLIKLDNGAEYLLFEKHEDMVEEAKDQVRQDLEDEPELFNQDFIDRHQDVTETDARLLAQDFAQSRLDGVEDELSSEIENEVRDDLSDKEDKENFEELVDDEVQKRLPKALEDKESDLVDELEEEIKSDFRDFIVNQEGLTNDENFQEEYGKFMHLDIDEAVEDAISEDGAEHFISRIDGESHEVGDGKVMVKEND